MRPTKLNLNRAERLEMSRRRSGLTQVEAAELFGVPPFRYKRWERGLANPPNLLNVTQLTWSEWCYVHRRRRGWTLSELETRTGLKARWLQRAEKGDAANVDALVEYWRRSA